jgi:protein-S-isoprenylcysteine O-methyltransferase Ste14
MILFLKNLLFTMVFPATVAGWLPWLLSRRGAPGSAAWVAAAVPLFAAGIAVYSWCVWDFASFGRGTPLPLDAPRKLVARGLYRYTRNPMYVGVLTTVLGWAALFHSPRLLAYAACVWTMFHLFVVLYEEPHLSRVFPGEYAEYRKRVPRWLPWPAR